MPRIASCGCSIENKWEFLRAFECVASIHGKMNRVVSFLLAIAYASFTFRLNLDLCEVVDTFSMDCLQVTKRDIDLVSAAP
jgi:hypothetical protein